MSGKRNRKAGRASWRWLGLLTLGLLASCDAGSRGAVLNALPMFTLTDAEEGRIGEQAEAAGALGRSTAGGGRWFAAGRRARGAADVPVALTAAAPAS